MPDMPPGWYADPQQPAQQRWWDGMQWTAHTAPAGQTPAATTTTAASALTSKVKVGLVVGGVVLAITILTRSIGALMVLAGFFLFFVAIYGIVRGSARLIRVRSRGASWAALGIAFVLMFVGTGANAALGGPGSSPTPDAAATSAAHSEAVTPTPEPTPSPKPTTYEEVEKSTAIPFERTAVDDPNIDVGQAPITTVGADGTKVTTYRITYVDGVEISREIVGEVVSVAPVNEVTSTGTRQPAPPPAPVPLVQPAGDCDGNYTGACVPIASDVDCAGGSGNGPAYVQGPVRVVGTDIYDLDRDGDGIACD